MGMAKCKDCEHFYVCKKYDPVVDFDMDDGVCLHFLNKVVRCKDCKHYTPVEGGKPLCALHIIAVAQDDFCSYGERREGE